MNTRFIVPAVAGLMLLSPAAFAAGSASAPQPQGGATKVSAADHCMALQKQFDEAVKTHGKAAKIKTARELRTESDKLCASDPKAGTRKMTQALRDLGVKPKG